MIQISLASFENEVTYFYVIVSHLTLKNELNSYVRDKDSDSP
jgi:hypothetical protein